ncbi:tetratricopeptide repeat protein [Cytobacillus pseudoceanisediminis]|uniref:tetratricopeptide repeat protein n=1 Tax=Cytobacillus pseudoceanisediminis TaxID=3051614 RepID=UPI003C2EF380
MKKLFWSIVIFTVVISLLIVYSLMNWTKPYELPDLNNEITLEQIGLSLNDEHKVMDAIVQSSDDPGTLPTSIEEINETNAAVTYFNAKKLLDGNGKEQELGKQYLERLVELFPENLIYSNRLRVYMLSTEKTNEYIQFLKDLSVSESEIKLQEALAYVDSLQDPSHGIASLGQTSASSIQLLDEILSENEYDWMAHYARGLNNLYWPVGLLKTEKAIQDLGYCLAVTQYFEDKNVILPLWPSAYVAYGDALVKNGDIQEGIAVWKEGHKLYPDFKELEDRSKANKEEAFEIIRKVRGTDIFERPNKEISDLSILWNEKGN